MRTFVISLFVAIVFLSIGFVFGLSEGIKDGREKGWERGVNLGIDTMYNEMHRDSDAFVVLWKLWALNDLRDKDDERAIVMESNFRLSLRYYLERNPCDSAGRVIIFDHIKYNDDAEFMLMSDKDFLKKYQLEHYFEDNITKVPNGKIVDIIAR